MGSYFALHAAILGLLAALLPVVAIPAAILAALASVLALMFFWSSYWIDKMNGVNNRGVWIDWKWTSSFARVGCIGCSWGIWIRA